MDFHQVKATTIDYLIILMLIDLLDPQNAKKNQNFLNFPSKLGLVYSWHQGLKFGSRIFGPI